MHPTSLPGPHGIGDLGQTARAWVDTLAVSGTRYWQLLPIGPTGYGDSPYQCFSSFAGNPYLISPDLLVRDGLISEPEDVPPFSDEAVDYGPVIAWKLTLLDRAYAHFLAQPSASMTDAFDKFIEENASWIHDYALFMVVKGLHHGAAYETWAPEFRDRHPATMDRVKADEADELRRVAFTQFLFRRQWDELHEYATSRGVSIIGDIPIFVSGDSADVWAARHLFEVDDTGAATLVAGVPPDYFSPTGQLWGNPQYRWEAHAADDFSWWRHRLAHTLDLVDLVRIDHFRAFADYWEIPAGATTAETGRWVDGPGAAFFDSLVQHFGELDIIAEDLGEISPPVFALRDQFDLPGMKILQFAFGSGEENPFLPHAYPSNCVAYTGTHDNDTTRGWWDASEEETRHHARTYLGVDGSDIAWDLIRSAWQSRAAISIAPVGDLLSLDTTGRMNTPGVAAGNWKWRLAPEAITDDLVHRLRTLNETTGRLAVDAD